MLIYNEAKARRKRLEIWTNNGKTETNFRSEIETANFKVKFKLKTAPLSFTQFISFRVGYGAYGPEKDRHKIVSAGQKQNGIFLWNTDEASEIGKIIKCYKTSIANESMFFMSN